MSAETFLSRWRRCGSISYPSAWREILIALVLFGSKIMVKEVPVERIIEKIIESPVEKIVYQVVSSLRRAYPD